MGLPSSRPLPSTIRDQSLRNGGHHDGGERVESNAGIVIPAYTLYQENELLNPMRSHALPYIAQHRVESILYSQ